MDFISCRHIMTSGQQCRSPRLRDADYCYFHKRMHARHQVMLKARREDAIINTEGVIIGYGRPVGFQMRRLPDLGPLEDRASVQMAISTVVNALATEGLDTKRATALLYGLQLASANCPRADKDFYSEAYDPIEETEQAADGSFLAPGGRIPAAVLEEEAERIAKEEKDAEEEEELARITKIWHKRLGIAVKEDPEDEEEEPECNCEEECDDDCDCECHSEAEDDEEEECDCEGDCTCESEPECDCEEECDDDCDCECHSGDDDEDNDAAYGECEGDCTCNPESETGAEADPESNPDLEETPIALQAGSAQERPTGAGAYVQADPEGARAFRPLKDTKRHRASAPVFGSTLYSKPHSIGSQ